MATPAPVFPAAVATDAQLKVANNLIQTTLRVNVDASNTILFVNSTAGFVANSLVSIDKEIVSIQSIVASPNPQLIVAGGGRGFDGTSAAAHSAGAKVSMFMDAWHHNALSSEVKAIETFLGPNGQNLSVAASSRFRYAIDYQFSQTPGGTLTAATVNTVTLSPVPKGLNATDAKHYVYISGGTGTAEAVLIVGGTAVSGAASGTIMFTPANAHSGAWTVSSATGGIAEAIVGHTPNTGGVGACIILSPITFNIYAPIEIGGLHGLQLRGAGIGSTFLNMATAASDFIQVSTNVYYFGFYDCSIVSTGITRTGGWIIHGMAAYNQNGFLKNSHLVRLNVANQMNGFWFTQYAGVFVTECEMNTFVNFGIAIKAGQTTTSDVNQGSGLFLNDFTIYGSDFSIGGNPANLALGTGLWIEDSDAVYVRFGEIGNTRDCNVRIQASGTGHSPTNHFFDGLVSDGSMGQAGAGFLVTGPGSFSELFLRDGWFSSSGAWSGNINACGIRIDTGNIGRFEIDDCFAWNNNGPGLYISSTGGGGAPGYINMALSGNGARGGAGFIDSIYINIPVNTPGPFLNGCRDTGPGGAGVSVRTSSTTNLIKFGANVFTGMSLGASAQSGFLALATTGSLGGAAMTAGQSVSVVTAVPGARIIGMTVVASPQVYPGDGFRWQSYVNGNDSVTTVLTCVVAGTSNQSVYYLRVSN